MGIKHCDATFIQRSLPGFFALVVFIALTNAGASGNIQGLKLDAAGVSYFNSPGATITLDTGATYGPAVNPYTAIVAPGGHTVQSSVPSGYSVSYSSCNNCINHPESSYVFGSQVQVYVTDGGYVDLWWKYIPTGNITANSTPPGAAIWYSYNGGAWTDAGAITNYTFIGQPAGTYQGKLVKAGYQDWVQTQTLPAGGSITFNGVLTPVPPAPGNITANSTPPGAAIWYSYNGGAWTDAGAITNYTFTGQPAGTYQGKLVKAGYQDWVQTQTLPAGGSITFNGVLTPVVLQPPVLTSVSPNSGMVGQLNTVILNGSNFSQETKIRTYDTLGRFTGVEFSAAGQPLDKSWTFTFIDSSRIELSFAFSTPYGPYYIEALNGTLTSPKVTYNLTPNTNPNLQLVQTLAPYTDSVGGTHKVELYRIKDWRSAYPVHFMVIHGSLINGARAPHPLVVLNHAAYSSFPFPPSDDPVDAAWAAAPTPALDISLPPSPENRQCFAADCFKHINFDDFNYFLSLSDRYLKNGYAVAHPYTRFYAARDDLSGPYEVISVIESLKTFSDIDSSRIGMFGGSRGGYLTAYALSRADRPLTIKAAVAAYPPIDFTSLEDYYFQYIPTVQPTDKSQASQDFAIPYANRAYRSIGRTRSLTWNAMSNSNTAGNLSTPLLLYGGTDDMMVPISQPINLYNSLKALGKQSNKYIYQNGPPLFATKSANEVGHGLLDATSPVKAFDILMENFLFSHIPSDVTSIPRRHPENGDLIAILSSYRQDIYAAPAEKSNLSDLIIQMANPKIYYTSSDSRIPSGNGPSAIAAAINYVWSQEKLSWSAADVIVNLQAGMLPSVVTGRIQGLKLDSGGVNYFNSPGGTITIDAGSTYGPAVNPYTATVAAGAHTVQSSVPSGYSVAYSLCNNCTDHPASGYVPGSQVTVNVVAGGYADLWWKYTPIAVIDTAAPSVPAGLAAVAVSPTQVNLSWTVSTDNVGVTGYKIFRGGVQIGASVSNSFQNSGLAPATAYSYTVAANDAAGNVSGQSAAATAATSAAPDTAAPSVPAGLAAVAVSSTQVNLSWTVSTDNVGVTGYKIFRGGVQIGASVSNSFQNSGLAPATAYSYTVAANDAAGNVSGQSAAATATTSAAPSVVTGRVQGLKLDSGGVNYFNSPGATITIDAGSTYGPAVNPYTATVAAGAHTVQSSVPSGYSAAYSLCNNCMDHPASSYIPGSQVAVNVTAGGYADLWWKYTPAATVPPVPALLTPANGAANIANNPSFSWSASAGAEDYWIDLSADPALAWFWNRNTTATGISWDGGSGWGRYGTAPVPPATLTASTKYYWRVCAHNAAGFSTCSPWSFTTQGTEPPPQNGIQFGSASLVYDAPGNRYVYAPSIIVAGDVEHSWACYNNTDGLMKDYVLHIRRQSGSAVTDIALAPSASGWDGQHNCDPNVVAGQFLYQGVTYAYAMFFTGNPVDGGALQNQVGVAFSNSLDGPWSKYPNPIISYSGSSWGAGQPSAINMTGQGSLLLSYTLGDTSGTKVMLSDVDLSDMANPRIIASRQLSNNGLSGDWLNNMDIAYDPSQDRFYGVREVHPYPADYPSFIGASVQVVSMPSADFRSGGGSWTVEGEIAPSLTGFTRNHNAGFERTAYGNLPDPGSIRVVFADSCSGAGCPVPAEWSYDLWSVTGNRAATASTVTTWISETVAVKTVTANAPTVVASTSTTTRSMNVSIPSESFSSDVVLSLKAPYNMPPPDPVLNSDMKSTGIGMEITLDQAVQPLKAATLELTYTDAELSGVDRTKLVLARYDEGTKGWIPLESVSYPRLNRVVGKTTHFSLFQVMVLTAGVNLNGARIYPNPFYPSKGHTQVSMDGVPEGTTVKVYTLNGELVWEGKASAAGLAVWYGRNKAGRKVASGLYLVHLESGGQKKIKKVSVVK